VGCACLCVCVSCFRGWGVGVDDGLTGSDTRQTRPRVCLCAFLSLLSLLGPFMTAQPPPTTSTSISPTHPFQSTN
jgi:hypothetical protein